MTTARPAKVWLAVLLGLMALLSAESVASAQTYIARGEIGFLQEWEISATLAKSANRRSDDYTGAVTLRHTGLCSANGSEEKSGTVQLEVSAKTHDIEGTLSLPEDHCRVSATAAQRYSGLLTCKNGEAIPIRLSLELSKQPASGVVSPDSTDLALKNGR